MTRIIVKAVRSRMPCVRYLQKHLPHVEICFDTKGHPNATLMDAMRMAGDDPCIHMEEDVILTVDFIAKVEREIAARPDEVIQFFSRRNDDIKIGSRYDPPYKFLCNVCFYFPAGYSRELVEFVEQGKVMPKETYADVVVRDFLALKRKPYWICVPNPVQHMTLKSAIDSRRSSRRQSPTFIDPLI